MRNLFMILFLNIIGTTTFAQLSPPGLGETKTAFWSAIGVKQKINAKNSSTTYFGIGRISGDATANMFNKPSIMVLNEEVYHKISPNLQYSVALSYRRQHEYEEFEVAETESVQQEFRLYGRLAYTAHPGQVEWKTTLREEVRKFYDSDFGEVSDGLQLRTRFKTQVAIPLDTDKENNLLGSAEALFSVTDDVNDGWGNFGYKESRFCLYYSYAPDNLPVVFDVGYMNDLIGHGHHVTDASYLALDIIIKNPFSS